MEFPIDNINRKNGKILAIFNIGMALHVKLHFSWQSFDGMLQKGNILRYASQARLFISKYVSVEV
jgi:hypothetical protein